MLDSGYSPDKSGFSLRSRMLDVSRRAPDGSGQAQIGFVWVCFFSLGGAGYWGNCFWYKRLCWFWGFGNWVCFAQVPHRHMGIRAWLRGKLGKIEGGGEPVHG